ncbi:hypothetical protein, partial [Vibrio jasicida]|uniref:hypothetical protein n=1 Tax=Vibrio jasicida TaxID=766224 RepID=UPI003919DB74
TSTGFSSRKSAKQFWIDIKNRKPRNRLPIISQQKDRSTDPYLIYIAHDVGFVVFIGRVL